MSTRVHLDRKERWTFALIGVMVLLLPVLAVRSYISRVSETTVLAYAGPTDERFVSIDGRGILVPPEALGKTMADWLKLNDEKTLILELSDRTFVPGAAAPSEMGRTRVRQLAGLAHEDPPLMVHILRPTNAANAVAQNLEEQRSSRLRDDLVTNGVSAAHVAIDDEQDNLPTAKSRQIAILLSK